ncbi:MAG TPA: efflux RND transporter periplasmic adaptor subunit [Blastocatellia bacterium]|nr:efflux RND transporter periplasmic adaptor subunit [Blastocatellia bacterium]
MAVSKKKKIIITVVVILLLGAIIGASVFARRGDLPEVQTAKVEKRPLLESKVTANGEVRPIQFINLTAEVSGRVTDVYVKEGDQVKKGTALVRVDPTQASSQTDVNKAQLQSAQADVQNQQVAINVAENAINTARASLNSAQADLERAKVDRTNAEIEFKRQTDLVESGIASRSAFDTAKARYDSAVAAVNAAQARVTQSQSQIRDAEIRVNQAKASLAAAQARVAQTEASLRSSSDLLRKTTQYATINGVIVGPLVQVGTFALANFSSTPLMIIADMSVINVEVRVDESDIANVKTGQKVKVKVDALGDTQVDGDVVEIAQSAVTRTGESIATTALKANTEAKDFKVVIRVTDTRQEIRDRLRPGMSATATIFTDKRENVIAVPLQALVERDQSDLRGEAKPAASPAPAADKPKDRKSVKGVFVVRDNKAHFTPVETGITGDNDIEITKGLNVGEEIVTGPYRQLRSLKDNTAIKREDKNKKAAPAKDETK